MPEISDKPGVVTQITMVEAEPGKQDEILRLMTERAKFMAQQPGFVSISLHRGVDGTHVVNYIQWESRDLLQAAHRAPGFRERWPELGRLAEEAVPNLYELAHIETR